MWSIDIADINPGKTRRKWVGNSNTSDTQEEWYQHENSWRLSHIERVPSCGVQNYWIHARFTSIIRLKVACDCVVQRENLWNCLAFGKFAKSKCTPRANLWYSSATRHKSVCRYKAYTFQKLCRRYWWARRLYGSNISETRQCGIADISKEIIILQRALQSVVFWSNGYKPLTLFQNL